MDLLSMDELTINDTPAQAAPVGVNVGIGVGVSAGVMPPGAQPVAALGGMEDLFGGGMPRSAVGVPQKQVNPLLSKYHFRLLLDYRCGRQSVCLPDDATSRCMSALLYPIPLIHACASPLTLCYCVCTLPCIGACLR